MSFREPWSAVVNKGFSNYNSLSRAERIWFNIEPLITGGLWDHYANYGADKNSDTIEDLEFIDFHSVAKLLSDFNNKYFPNGIPDGPDARQEQFDKFPEEELENDIETLDDKFWAISDQLEKSLVNHLQNSGYQPE